MVTTCQGIHLPADWRAFFTISSSPPQQGTSMRTTVDNGYQLVRSYRTVDPNCHSTCTLKGNRSLHSISSAENASVSFYGHCTHYT
mgnify:CR=1 FL=1